MISIVELMTGMRWYVLTVSALVVMLHFTLVYSILPFKFSNLLFHWIKRNETKLEKMMILYIGSTTSVMSIYIILENFVKF